MDRKPPFLESECKVLYENAVKRLQKLVNEINEAVPKIELGEPIETRLNGLFNEASAVSVQIKHYKGWLWYYNTYKTFGTY